MSIFDDVHKEALHDWLDERPGLAADELPPLPDRDGPCCDCECRDEDGCCGGPCATHPCWELTT